MHLRNFSLSVEDLRNYQWLSVKFTKPSMASHKSYQTFEEPRNCGSFRITYTKPFVYVRNHQTFSVKYSEPLENLRNYRSFRTTYSELPDSLRNWGWFGGKQTKLLVRLRNHCWFCGHVTELSMVSCTSQKTFRWFFMLTAEPSQSY